MAIIEGIANRLRRRFTTPEERGEYSSGYLPYLVRKKVAELIETMPEGRLLEIGSGEGLFLSEISLLCPRMDVTGIEPWGEILEKSRVKIKVKNLQKVTILKGVSQLLPFRDESFDHVVCINLLLNLPTRKAMEETLSEMVRVCKRSGSIYFDFRNSLNPIIYVGYKLAPLHDPHIKVPLRMYRPGDIKGLLKTLGVERIRSYGIGMDMGVFSPAIIIQGWREKS